MGPSRRPNDPRLRTARHNDRCVASLFVREDEEPYDRRELVLEHELLVAVRELSGRMARVEALLSGGGTGAAEPRGRPDDEKTDPS